MGDGKTFQRNQRSDEMLARLANELVKADTENWPTYSLNFLLQYVRFASFLFLVVL